MCKIKKYLYSFTTLLTLLSNTISINAKTLPNFFKENEITLVYYDKDVITANPKRPPPPLAWTARQKASKGGSIMFEKSLFFTEYFFLVTGGFNFAMWKLDENYIEILSAFLNFKFYPWHFANLNPYIIFSIAGPSIMNRDNIKRINQPNLNLGGNFTFQDVFGLGVQIGNKFFLDVSARLWHYSNGGLFVHNPGFDIPLAVTFGMAFNGNTTNPHTPDINLAGLYLGGGAGLADANYNQAIVNQKHDDFISAILELGYDFNDYVALEAGEAWLRNVQFTTVNPNNTIKVRHTIFHTAAKLKTPRYMAFNLFAKAGGAITAIGSIQDQQNLIYNNKNIFTLCAGAGISAELTNNFAIDLAWLYVQGKKTANLPNTNLGYATVFYRFS